MAVDLQTLIDRSIKNMGAGINPRVKEYAVELVRRAYAEGIYAQISSGYRSNAEQQKLYNQGRTTPGNIVTNAKPGQSVHNYGLAIDFFIVSDDGKTAIWTVNAKWKRVAAIGKSMGFQWGGDWRSFPDYPHLDMQKGLSLAQLAAGKRPTIPALGPATAPTPVAAKNYLAYDDRGEDVKAMQQALTKAGYSVEATGYFNADTKRAVMAFQTAAKLTADGVYGAATKAALAKATPPSTVKPAAKPTPAPTKEDELLELSSRERQEIAATFKKARERGVFSSAAHEAAILDGKMTQSQLLYLSTLIAGAALVGGKRIE